MTDELGVAAKGSARDFGGDDPFGDGAEALTRLLAGAPCWRQGSSGALEVARFFDMVPGGEERIAARRALSSWCSWMQTCPAAQVTRPVLTKETMA